MCQVLAYLGSNKSLFSSFLDDIDRIASLTYKPTHDDILHARVSTLGIVEISFPFRGLTLT